MLNGTGIIMENSAPLPAHPEILAPAGDEECFLAALAAGADAIYLGLKIFSARMEAQNFTMEQLARLTDLAHEQSCRVHVAMNVLLKPEELDNAYKLTRTLATETSVDGLIIQDLGMTEIIRQAGFKGVVTFSTLANVSNPLALQEAQVMGANRVVIPRELSLDEMKVMGAACPENLALECFVHGALCYCVSGRCYWSTYMGGKSGLRGRCVQPCRRMYSKKIITGKNRKEAQKSQGGERYFSCQDLELGEIVRLLLEIPHLESWKIEGRKKGPHYVYHTVTAYKILRDYPDNAQKRKLALEILDLALGRPGVKGRFLAHRNLTPMAPDKQTASGKLAGHIQITQKGECVLKPHFQLLPKDYLRIGTQDERWHSLFPVNCKTPKGGTLTLKIPAHKTPRARTPVYLVDRREPELIKLIAEQKKKLENIPSVKIRPVNGSPELPEPCGPKYLPDMYVAPASSTGSNIQPCLGKNRLGGIWLYPRIGRFSPVRLAKMAFWLPPVLWPDNEEDFSGIINRLERDGAKNFVCNSPWQIRMFKDRNNLNLIAGPFCNASNSLALQCLKEAGFKSAFASPELSRKDLLLLPRNSPLPLAFVLGAFWPVGLSRFGLAGIETNEPFTSPMGETFWARNYGGTIWLYPAWTLNLCDKKPELVQAGFSFFAWMDERPPASLPMTNRPGLFNWENELK